jgi:hypothetical protein
LPPTATPTPVPPTPTATPKPSAIQDEPFEADYKDECETDVEIVAVEGDSFWTSGTVSVHGGRAVLWCYGAKHTWIGELAYAGYTFASDEDDPLQFTVDEDRGYLYLEGKGSVTLPDGTRVTFP